MDQQDYKAMWQKLFKESLELADLKIGLENDLNEVKSKLDNVEKTLEYLQPLAGIPAGDNLSGLGMTDAIRAVLKKAKRRMGAADVRNALQHGGVDLSDLSAPMSSIYTVLARLCDGSEPEVVREKEGNQVFYWWKKNQEEQQEASGPSDDLAQSAEISDDDIPF